KCSLIDEDDEKALATAFKQELAALDIEQENISNALSQHLGHWIAQQNNSEAYKTLLDRVVRHLPSSSVQASLPKQYQHMAKMLAQNLQAQPLDEQDETILANALLTEIESMGYSSVDATLKKQLQEQLGTFAIQSSNATEYQALLSNILSKLEQTTEKPLDYEQMFSDIELTENTTQNLQDDKLVAKLATMAKEIASDENIDDIEVDLFQSQLREALSEVQEENALYGRLTSQLSEKLLDDEIAQALLQTTLETLQEEADKMASQTSEVVKSDNYSVEGKASSLVAGEDEVFASPRESILPLSKQEIIPEVEQISESHKPVATEIINLSNDDTSDNDIASISGAVDVNKIEDSETILDIKVSDNTENNQVSQIEKSVTETAFSKPQIDDISSEPSLLDGAEALWNKEYQVSETDKGLSKASSEKISESEFDGDLLDIQSTDKKFANISKNLIEKQSVGNRQIGNALSQPVVRLSEELSTIARHTSLSDAFSTKSDTRHPGMAAFLNAIDQFETLSQRAEKDSSPELIDDLIESVYDIEDVLDTSATPDWIWRMLDAIEQLLLMHKTQEGGLSLNAVSILRESAQLIEHYNNDNETSAEEANKTINALMSARQTLSSRMTPASLAVPAVATSDDVVSSQWQQSHEWTLDPNANSELVETFLDEAVMLLGRSQLEIERWDEQREQLGHLDVIRRDMHTLKGSARMAGYFAIGDLTHAVESMLESIIDGYSKPSNQAVAILSGAMWQAMLMLDAIRDGYLPQTDPYILNNINQYLGLPLPYPEVAENEKRIKAEEKAALKQPQIASVSALEQIPEQEAIVDKSAIEKVYGSSFDENIDPVLVDIFSDEAQELIEQAGVLLTEDLTKKSVVDELKRNMHTLKGGARLVGLVAIGDVSHLMESVIEQLGDVNETKLRQAKTLLGLGHETLYSMLDSVLRQEMPTPAGALNYSLEQFVKEGKFTLPTSSEIKESKLEFTQQDKPELETSFQKLQEESNIPSQTSEMVSERELLSEKIEEKLSVTTDLDESASMPLDKDSSEISSHQESTITKENFSSVEPTQTQVEETASQEEKIPEPSIASEVQRYVRVDAKLLDEMIAMVGETAIIRSRIENISSESEFNLTELTRIATRIDEQMRRLDNETEAQMLFRREAQEHDDEHFDPLEMDRFSEIQQLSRQLAEAINDLKNVQDTLATENTLLRNLSSQQGVIQRGLQERLLTTQLIRFDVNEARLKRLVRQTAKSVGKEVTLILEGGEVELERRLIEDILPAIEHMIRNAIGHGIEPEKERIAAGKPPIGVIKLSIIANASNVEIRILDDGRGFDYERIKEKAREKGWLNPDKENDHQYLNSLLMRSGFSTAKTVTQLSGRGVGMDVVNEMIKQRRGQLQVDSIPGQGTQFVITMPFSMSIAEVLLVGIAGQTYAAPMSAVAAISQLSREELERSYQGEETYHHYNGMDYRIYILGKYFNPNEFEWELETESVPALFVNAGGEPVVLYVDHIGNRLEIIVKNVNRQVLNVPGISGATILGDGDVVPVLDLLDLSRRINGLGESEDAVTYEEPQAHHILVVDDSVTMRKVSTRLLERNGYVVETAKDGLDAIEVLTRFTPDLILLDIEMPRMDGFEFASHVRQNSEHKTVPIVMVTSRTGEKHRERAEEIGVQGYLGKPYQEDVLIETLQSLIGGTDA
uniref:hybrid sensor histidine kinase/response regulator n=1 Tax=Suttonella ornithocola TaxID=279832 RepID=UPI000AF58807